MSAWRTDPNTPLSHPRHLGEKFADLGWSRLFKVEQRRIRRRPDAVCQHLPPDRIEALTDILGTIAPIRRSTKPLPCRGKDALMEKVRRTFRANDRKAGDAKPSLHAEAAAKIHHV